jgi:hypothetical protein
MGTTTVSPLLPFDLGLPLQGLQYATSPLSFPSALPDTHQMARSHNYNLVWCLLPIHQRRSASYNTTTTQTIMNLALINVIGIVHYHIPGLIYIGITKHRVQKVI